MIPAPVGSRSPRRFWRLHEFFEPTECRYRLDEFLIMSTPQSSNVLH